MTVSDLRPDTRSVGASVDGKPLPSAVRGFPARTRLCGPVTRARQVRSLGLSVGIAVLAAGMIAAGTGPALEALGVGLVLPGGGFLVWAGPGNPMKILAIGLFAASLLVFLVSVAVWFATGNIVLPVAVWLAAALGAAGGGVFGWGETPGSTWPLAGQIVPVSAVSALLLVCAAASFHGRRGLRRRAALNGHLRSMAMVDAGAKTPSGAADEALSLEDLWLMRLLLDRALQPIETFDGFHWIDQFQTAAVRYQLNFSAYALSIVRAVHLPACHGYLDTAQENLIAKQQDQRVWRYWRNENLWGNLRL